MNYLWSSKIGPPSVTDDFMQVYAIGDTLIATGGDICVSTDVGKSWISTAMETPSAPYKVARTLDGALVVCGVDSMLTTENAGLSWEASKTWLPKTRWFLEVSPSVRFATVDNNSKYILCLSRNGGQAWTEIDTIRFSNSSRMLIADSRTHDVVWYHVRYDVITMLLEGGDIVSTVDSGRTWLDRGNIGARPCAGRNVTITHDDHALVATASGLWRIPPEFSQSAKPLSIGRFYGGALQIDDSTCYAYRAYATVKTSDGGATWYCWYEPLSPDLLRVYPLGAYVSQVSTVSARCSTDVTVSQQFRRMLYNASSNDANLKLLSISELNAGIDGALGDQYVAGRQVWNTWNSLYAILGEGKNSVLANSKDNGVTFDTVAQLPMAVTRHVALLGSETFIADDSLRIRDGDDWRYFGHGLPFDSLGVQPVRAIVKSRNGAVVVGLGGTRYIDTNDVITDVGGGLYKRGSQSGAWTRIPDVSVHDVNVMGLHTTRNGAILATLCIVSKQQTFDAYRQDDNVIVRSDDDGRSWTEVYHDVYGGSVLLNPLGFAEDSHGVLYASRTRGGVITSDDDGITWQDVPGWNSSARINDMTIDTNDVLYVATDSAVFMVRPTTTDISADDNSMYLSLSLQPNPAKLQTHIVIGNASKHRLESLTLVGTLGQATLDLTPQLLQQLHLKTVRIEVDTSSLPIGTYIAALRAGTQTRHVVLGVMR